MWLLSLQRLITSSYWPCVHITLCEEELQEANCMNSTSVIYGIWLVRVPPAYLIWMIEQTLSSVQGLWYHGYVGGGERTMDICKPLTSDCGGHRISRVVLCRQNRREGEKSTWSAKCVDTGWERERRNKAHGFYHARDAARRMLIRRLLSWQRFLSVAGRAIG